MDWRKLKNHPQYWQIFQKRAEIIDKIRQFFKKEGFLEIQTPLLAPALIPESYLEVFETELKDKLGKKKRAYLTPSPELWHKKLLVAGAKKIFEITKSFRNTDLGGSLHVPEFTILEWYRTEADYKKTMDDCQNLIRFLVAPKKTLTYQGKTIRVDELFEKITINEAFQKYGKTTPEKDFEINYVKYVEPNLGWQRPTIIYDFPAKFAPLAKTSPQNPAIKQRFELYLFGKEIADGYTELTNPTQQAKEFKKEQKKRQELKKINHPTDTDFLSALKTGLPPCSGVALGIDRLVMILTNQTDIKKVILFSEIW